MGFRFLDIHLSFYFNFLQNAGSHSFSVGITEALNTNLLIELNADDIEYVYQRYPAEVFST